MNGQALMGRTLKVMYAQPSKRIPTNGARDRSKVGSKKRRPVRKEASKEAPSGGDGQDEDPLEA